MRARLGLGELGERVGKGLRNIRVPAVAVFSSARSMGRATGGLDTTMALPLRRAASKVSVRVEPATLQPASTGPVVSAGDEPSAS